MNFTALRLNAYGAKFASLLGTTSLLTMGNTIAHQERASAAEAVAASEEVPENVLITGSLIHGVPPVGVPVIKLAPRDFAQTASLTTADLFKNFPAANVTAGTLSTDSGARLDRTAKINLRGLDSGTAVRSLLMVDGMRIPPQSTGICAIDPSIIPSISLDHIDVLVDGASAIYGSDAIGGVINIILKRGYDGALSQLRYTTRAGGGARYQASQLWGRTWDGGQITLSYEWYNEVPVKGNAFSNFGVDHSPWGYDDRTPIGSSIPGTISVSPQPNNANQLGTACGYRNDGVNPIVQSSCYAIPLGTGRDFNSALNSGIGPLAPGSASTLNWATFSADTNFAGPLNPTAGTRNQFNPYSRGWYDAAGQRNGGAITADQRLTKDISFYGEAFYSNRRSQFLNPSNRSVVGNNLITLVAVPTFNPYYPAGGALTNLRVSYDIGLESPGITNAYEVAARYQLGLNIALPAGWSGQLYYSETYDSSFVHVTGSVNKAAVSAALGWTIAPVAPVGSAPAFGSWTKPTAIPYLNLFCDPIAFQCNAMDTLNYIAADRNFGEKFWINEKGMKFDGPLFDLPGGMVKAAIGATLSGYRFNALVLDNAGGANLTIAPLTDPEGRAVWAVFTQVNLPIFGDNNSIAFFRRLELEASWRHDQYSDAGGTSNPKLAFNWSPVENLTIRGSWGVSFRAPLFGEISSAANSGVGGANFAPDLATGGFTLGSNCTVGTGVTNGTVPPVGSAAYKLQKSAQDFNNAMFAAGQAGYSGRPGCVSTLPIPDPSALTPYTDAAGNVFSTFADLSGFTAPPGISVSGAAKFAEPIRAVTGLALHLEPELSTNWGIGFDYAPSNILEGLDIQATYYVVKINGVLRAFGAPTSTTFNDAQVAFAHPVPSDVGCPDLFNKAVPSIPIPANLVPSACPQFMAMARGVLVNPNSTVLPAAQTLVMWINDGAVLNKGWQKLDGIDWSWGYDWDMGDLGAFNIGQVGTYYLHNLSETIPGAPGSVVTDGFHTTVAAGAVNMSVGVPTLPVMRYRGHLGWTKGPWNVTGFVDYISHYVHTQNAPPNVNNQCVSAGSALGGGTFPCAQNGYTNGLPPWYSFDLSLGYDTGEDPANDYLKNIGIQMVVQNLMDKHADYQYRIQTGAGQPCTCDILRPNYGRQISVIVTKTW